MNRNNTITDCPYGEKYQAFWDMLSPRERLMKFDAYGLFAITPRAFSRPIIERIQGDRIVDACCSVGGMSIALAEAGKHVVAIELNPHRLQLARDNAAMCGVNECIEFIEGDVLEALPTLTADTIFFDGQWNTVHQETHERFSLADFTPNGVQFLKMAFGVTDAVVFRAPAHFDFHELAQFRRPYHKEATIVAGERVAYTVYLGHT